MRDHRARVDARIRAAGTMHARLRLENARDRFLHFLLHSQADFLHLPPFVTGAVIRNGELKSHGTKPRGCRETIAGGSPPPLYRPSPSGLSCEHQPAPKTDLPARK